MTDIDRNVTAVIYGMFTDFGNIRKPSEDEKRGQIGAYKQPRFSGRFVIHFQLWIISYSIIHIFA